MSKFVIKEVVCSFPHVFKPNTKFGPDGKREITIMLHKENHAELISSIQADIKEMQSKSSKPIPSDKICLKDGDESGRDEYQGHYTIKATSAKIVPIYNVKKDLLDADTCDVQGGDIVNASINLWLQDNSYGQRVNASLNGVQYVKEGSRFGGGGNTADDFELYDGLLGDDDDF